MVQSAFQDYRSLEISDRAGILTCVLNPPHRLNLIDADTHEQLEDFFYRLGTAEDVDVVVLTGAGDTFSAGGDLKDVGGGVFHKGLPGGAFTRGGLRLIRNLAAVPQPVIAAVNGDAAGLAASIALHCDIILMAEDGRIGDPHVTAGVVAGDGGAVAWPLQTSLSRAKEYLFTGELIPAREAERIGLVNHVYPREELQPAVDELAARLASGARYAVRWTKASLNKVLIERINTILDASLALEGLSAATPDHQEAIAAFFDKRPPRFAR